MAAETLFHPAGFAMLNAYTIYRQVHPDQQSTSGSRRRFLTDLADSFILPHMKTTRKITQLQKATNEAKMRCSSEMETGRVASRVETLRPVGQAG